MQSALDEPLFDDEPAAPRARIYHELHLGSIMNRRWRRIASTRLPPAVRQFLSSMLIYVLSRQWKDLIVVYILHTQPPPYCGPAKYSPQTPPAFLPCTPAAPAATQFLLAVALLFASPLVAAWQREKNLPTTVPTLVGMCVGWALGDALVQLQIELVDAAVGPPVGEPTGTPHDVGERNACNMLLALAATLASAAIILSLDRLGVRLRLRAALKLPSQGIGVMVMVTWAHTAKELITFGLPTPTTSFERDRGLYKRVLLLWAVCLSTCFALLVTKLVTCRRALVEGAVGLPTSPSARGGNFSSPPQQQPPPPPSAFSIATPESAPRSGPVNSLMNEDVEEDDELYSLYARENREAPPGPPLPVRRTPTRGIAPANESPQNLRAPTPQQNGFVFAFPQSELFQPDTIKRVAGERLDRCARPLFIEFLMLTEGATAWVTGCAATDAIVAWTSLGDYPTGSVAMQDLGVCILLTVLAIGWLALSGRRTDAPISESVAKASTREEVELFFMTNALTFVVGWSWIVLSRDLSTVCAAGIAGGATATWVHAFVAAIFAFLFGPCIGIAVGYYWGHFDCGGQDAREPVS